MQQTELALELRSRTGKNICRQLRKDGRLPGIVYGKGIDPVPVTLDPKDLGSILAGEGGQNTLLTVKGGGELNGSMVIIADILRESLKRTMLHVDLHKLNMNEKVRVDVPLALVASAAGVKEGGLLDFAHHTIEIECLPAQIPERIEVDITDLNIGQSIHVSDLKLPSGAKAVLEGRVSLVSVLGKAKEEGAAAAE